MGKKVSKSSITIILLLLIVQIITLLFFNQVTVSNVSNYLFLQLLFFISILLFSIIIIINDIDMFSSIILVTILNFLIFYITPLVDIITNNYLFFGIDIREGTKKATLIFFGGYIIYLLFFHFFSKKNRTMQYPAFSLILNKGSKKIVIFNFFMWIISFSVSLYNLLSSSKINESLGIVVVENSQTAANGIFSMLGYGLVVPWMYMMVLSKSKGLKIVVTSCTFLLYFLNAYRFIIVIMIIAYASFSFIKKGKRPTLIQILGILISTAILMSVIGYVRSFLRSGNTIDMSLFSFGEIIYTLQGNFGIYKSFYVMVTKMPEAVNFTHGLQTLYTFILFIPRFIWPSKPDTPLRTLIYPLLGDYALQAGTAWPNIGEYYSELGLYGVIIGYIFFSFLSFSIDKILIRKKTLNSKILGVILYGTIFQLTIRGYTPSNFWLVAVFLFFIFINYLYQQKFIRKEDLPCVISV
ncbi:oligosaccharide repeat unit polymerase [Enterococcus casseliflavus]|uniref:O-antigen polymerase n=1 Tax=Enterococcus casseliflavus TaxID=37734 RepID=UPI001AD701A2|nr:O-antigen polymerase [Enterococcus casseliflavus]MBO6357949.1 oligosaccharide repeat unit polymerase [Enterococcus casseliflavus]MBO6375595.1 oligosaccharide repeat unit polymerase [Enterococcus casseliflavus]